MKPSPVSLPLTTYSLAGPITRSAPSLKVDWPQSLVLGFLLWPLYTWPAHHHGCKSTPCSSSPGVPSFTASAPRATPILRVQYCPPLTPGSPPFSIAILKSQHIPSVFQAEGWKFSKGTAANSRVCKLHHPGDEFIFYLRNECIGFNMVASMQFPNVILFNTQYTPRK